MKKTLVLTAALLMLTVCCSCAPANGRPAAEETSAQDGALYFQLSDLPKIGSYYDETVYKRMTEDKVDVFQPSDRYGAVVPYIGDYRTYTWEEYDGTVSDYPNPLYGLMTTDGTVITDAVYDDAYTDSGLIILSNRTMDEEYFEIVNCTILPVSGKWKIDVDWLNKGERYGIVCSAENDRIYVCDGKTINGFDFSGKKLFTVQKSFFRYELVEETGCILLNNTASDGKYITTLLNKDGKELWTAEGCAGLGEDSTRYFPCGGGVLKADGTWLIKPKYEKTQVYGDRFFACDDGAELHVFDQDLKELPVEDDRIDYSFLQWFNGELLYSEYDDESRPMCYTFSGNEPITVKNKTMILSRPIDGTKMFFGIDTDGVGYFYTRDGTVKKTFSNAVNYTLGLNDDLFTVITGNDQKRVAHMVNVNTLTETFSYTCRDQGGKVEIRKERHNRDSTARHFLASCDSAYNNSSEEERLSYQVINAATGKTVAKDCDEVNVFVVNGKEYGCFVKDNRAVAVDEDENVLMSISASALD